MITFLDTPYRGTNTGDGFEILIHGFFIKRAWQEGGAIEDELWILCVDEDGVLLDLRLADGLVRTDWRFDRKGGTGWDQLKGIGEID